MNYKIQDPKNNYRVLNKKQNKQKTLFFPFFFFKMLIKFVTVGTLFARTVELQWNKTFILFGLTTAYMK